MPGGDEARIHFAKAEGAIPSSDMLERMGIKVFFGVGHETTGATTYSRSEILDLLDWIDRNPAEHHAVLDATSMLGAMPWGEDRGGAGDDQVLPVHAVPEGDRRHIRAISSLSLTPAAWPSWRRTRRNRPGQSRGS
jgi:hypothetical protein